MTLGEMNSGGFALHRGVEAASRWRCYRLPGAVPCLKGDNPVRRSWFFDVSTASCRINGISSCDVTDDVGNNFYTLDECVNTCLPGEHRSDLQGGPKKLHTELMAITLSILNGFSKFFHCWKAK